MRGMLGSITFPGRTKRIRLAPKNASTLARTTRRGTPHAACDQSGMRKLAGSVTALPWNAGIDRPRYIPATQLPTPVPPNGGETLTALTRPSGENVTCARPDPVGPPGCLQLAAENITRLIAAIAALLLSGPRWLIGGAAGASGGGGGGGGGGAAAAEAVGGASGGGGVFDSESETFSLFDLPGRFWTGG